ncbi:732_t:CDS:2 [Diversispora eburnea]|uniref:732_t:CDS:1 n=1 Tax=Diversispora eburnea TaxID=1213867 RepID=A0A9N9BWM4_9GLOM|nr:732_t:CDS:2 [Diversispora eburnea]
MYKTNLDTIHAVELRIAERKDVGFSGKTIGLKCNYLRINAALISLSIRVVHRRKPKTRYKIYGIADIITGFQNSVTDDGQRLKAIERDNAECFREFRTEIDTDMMSINDFSSNNEASSSSELIDTLNELNGGIAFKKAEFNKNLAPQLIVIITTNHSKPLYTEIKKDAEIELGIINTKIRGKNLQLADEDMGS